MSETSNDNLFFEKPSLENDAEILQQFLQESQKKTVQKSELLAKYSNDGSLIDDMKRFYMHEASKIKDEIDHNSAEMSLRLDKMRFVNDLVADINQITNEENGVEIVGDLIEKFEMARKLGVKISSNVKFNANQRNRLISNMQLSVDGWENENRKQQQKIDIFMRAFERMLLMFKDVERKENQAIHAFNSGLK